MATRDDLIAAFETNLGTGFLLPASGRNPAWTVMADGLSAIIEAEQSQDGLHDIETHIVFYWDDTLKIKASANFYVKDRGTVNEEAVWQRSRNPKQAADPNFNQTVYGWLRARIGQTFGTYTLRHVGDVRADNVSETGVAHLVVLDGTTTKWIEVLLRYENDAVTFDVITTA